jgi:hypothetical protein
MKRRRIERTEFRARDEHGAHRARRVSSRRMSAACARRARVWEVDKPRAIVHCLHSRHVRFVQDVSETGPIDVLTAYACMHPPPHATVTDENTHRGHDGESLMAKKARKKAAKKRATRKATAKKATRKKATRKKAARKKTAKKATRKKASKKKATRKKAAKKAAKKTAKKATRKKAAKKATRKKASKKKATRKKAAKKATRKKAARRR